MRRTGAASAEGYEDHSHSVSDDHFACTDPKNDATTDCTFEMPNDSCWLLNTTLRNGDIAKVSQNRASREPVSICTEP